MARKRKRSKAEQPARQRQRRQQRLLWVGGGLLALILLGVWLYSVATRPQPGEFVASLGNRHIDPSETFDGYNSVPPTSGPHFPFTSSWGIHSEPIPNETQVHNLEDGGVMVQYNCPEGCEPLVEQLRGVVARYEEQVILAPYPDMEARIALTAWQRIRTLDSFDEETIVSFIEAYRGIDHH